MSSNNSNFQWDVNPQGMIGLIVDTPSSTHHRSWHTPRLETTQPGAVWQEHQSKWTYGCFPDLGKLVHQWRWNPMSCLPNVPQRGDIDLVRWTSSKVHRQLWHFIERFSAQYATSRSQHMTFTALASLRQAENESLSKFMDRFGCIVI